MIGNVVLVSGARDLNDKKLVFSNLDRVHAARPIECVLHGACPNRRDDAGVWYKSADMLAEDWARFNEIAYFGIPAKWRTGGNGKKEGPIRNSRMASMTPHYAVIFPGGSGTQDMLDKVIQAQIPYEVVK